MRRAFLLLATLLAAPLPAHAGWDEGAAAYQRKDWATALRELKPLADGGHAGALARLGQMTLHGRGVARDEAAALRLLTAAADKGDAMAQNALARLYFLGIGTQKDLGQAVLWFTRAADQGLPSAQTNLGRLHMLGNGVPKDEAKAVVLLRKAAEQGHEAAWESLGSAYWDGTGVTPDHAEAVRWFRKAAERGLIVSQNRLGSALWNGDGTAKNMAEAVRWFERAGEQGNPASLYNVSLAYTHGVGAPKDAEKAAVSAILAARLGTPAEKPKFEQARDKLRQTTPAAVWAAAEAKAAAWTPKAESGQRDEAAAAGAAAAAPAPAPRPSLSAGSGVIVNREGHVLTNSHVVAACRNIRVSLEGQPAQAASVVARDAGNDLAVLKASFRPTDVARFREDKPLRAGDGVVAIGYPMSSLLSREPNVTAGVISAMAGIKGDKRHYQVTAPVQKGNSGGPLADMNGNVVGIISSKLDAMKIADKTGDLPQNVNFAIKAELARQFLTDNGVAYETAPAGTPLSPADVGDIMRKATVFVECEG